MTMFSGSRSTRASHFALRSDAPDSIDAILVHPLHSRRKVYSSQYFAPGKLPSMT